MTLTNPQAALLAAAIASLNPKSPFSVMSTANDYMDWLEGYAGYYD